MKVLLVYTVSEGPEPPRRPILEWIEISFAVSYLAGALKRAGHEVELLVLRHGRFEQEVLETIERFQPGLIGYTAVATEFEFIKRIAGFVSHERPELYQIIGGAHVTLRPEDALEGAFDAVCLGEGEDALIELAETLERGQAPAGIQNLWLRGPDGEVERNPTRPFVPELDALPIADREIWRPWIEENPKHTILIARGCPFTCTYCSNHALWKVAPGKYVRFRSVENVIAELDQLVEEFPDASYCYFEVETVSADEAWARRFAAALEEWNGRRELPMEFAINLRVLRHHSFASLFEVLSSAGFSYLRIGIESGSERVRREVLERHETNEELTRCFEEAQEAGLEVFAYNLIGMPGETPEDFEETIALNQHPAVTRSYLSIFYPYPGTKLEQVCADRGIDVPPLQNCAERHRAYLSLPEFPNRRIESYYRRFFSLVHGSDLSLFQRADEYVWRTIRGYPRIERVARRLRGRGVMTRFRKAGHAMKSVLGAGNQAS